MSTLTANELLCFVSVQYDKLSRDILHTTIHDFYTNDEAAKAKLTLINEVVKVLDPNLIKEPSTKRILGKAGVKQKLVKDVLDIWQILDRVKAGQLSTRFVAAD